MMITESSSERQGTEQGYVAGEEVLGLVDSCACMCLVRGWCKRMGYVARWFGRWDQRPCGTHVMREAVCLMSSFTGLGGRCEVGMLLGRV